MAAGLTLLLAASSGCVNPKPIEGTDRNVFFPAFRASSGLLRRAGGEAGFILGGELDAAFGAGSSSQDLTASEAIRFQGTSFSGPGRVSADYELAVWSLSMRSGYMFAQAIALEGITGASFVSREMELESGVRSERDSDIFIGPLIGIAASVRASSWLSFEARTTQMLATAPPMSLGTTEIGAEMIPSPNLAVFAGWRWWEYEEEGLNINSDIELQMSGPTLGLRVRF